MDDISRGIITGVLSTMIALTVLEILVPFIKKHVPANGAKVTLKFNPLYRFLVSLVSASFLALPYVLFTEAKTTPVIINLLVSGVGLGISLHIFGWVNITSIQISSQGLLLNRPWLAPVRIGWEEIDTIKYLKSYKNWQVEAREPRRRIKVSAYMDGFQDFLDKAQRHSPSLELR